MSDKLVWEEMRDRFEETIEQYGNDWHEGFGYAAELRFIADLLFSSDDLAELRSLDDEWAQHVHTALLYRRLRLLQYAKRAEQLFKSDEPEELLTLTTSSD